MSFIKILLGGLFVFQLMGQAASFPNPDNTTKTFPAKEEVEIQLLSGDCIIELGEEGLISVDVTARVSPAEAFKPKFFERGNRLVIEEEWSGRSSGEVRWVIRVPKKTELDIETVSGDVSVDGLQSEVEISTASGDVTVRNFDGEVKIETASGDITLEALEGDIEVSVASGEIDVSQITGKIELSAASGDIDIRDSQGEFDLSCASGEIDAQQIELTSHSEFSVASGDLEVVLAKSPEFDLSLSTASGELTLDYQGNPLVGKFEAVARKDRGQINLPVKTDKEETFTRNGKEYIRKMFRVSADKPLITLETASGEVTLKK